MPSRRRPFRRTAHRPATWSSPPPSTTRPRKTPTQRTVREGPTATPWLYVRKFCAKWREGRKRIVWFYGYTGILSRPVHAVSVQADEDTKDTCAMDVTLHVKCLSLSSFWHSIKQDVWAPTDTVTFHALCRIDLQLVVNLTSVFSTLRTLYSENIMHVTCLAFWEMRNERNCTFAFWWSTVATSSGVVG